MNKKILLAGIAATVSYLYLYSAGGSAVGALPVSMAVTTSEASEEFSTPERPSAAEEEARSVAPDSVATEEIGFDPDSAYTLDDLVVATQKRLVENDGATLTYNVTEDPDAKSNNLLEILRKVPGVSVDGEENVKVNGSSSFKILMNGREDPMLQGDLKTVLKSLPANSIKKIEVISEPGSKYEAEGVGGILNIVTDKTQNLSGIMAQLNGWFGNGNYGAYGSLKAKVKNVMLSASVNYNDWGLFHRYYETTQENEDLTGDENHLRTEKNRRYSKGNYTGANVNMSWEPDTLNLVTLSAQYGYNTWDNPGNSSQTMQNPAGYYLWSLQSHISQPGLYYGVSIQPSYQHTFGKEGHTLVASYMFNWNRSTSHSINDYYDREGDYYSYESEYTDNYSRSMFPGHILQIDYSNPFNGKHLLEAGAKMNLGYTRTTQTPYYGEDAADALPATDESMNVAQFKDIYALYASYTGKFGDFNLKGGLRYEYTHMGMRYRTPGYENFTTELHDVVPNLALSYNFTPASSLRFAYQLRIWRPNLYNLNPYRNYLTPGAVTYGNPDLKSEKGNTFSLSYSNYEHKVTGSAKVTYRYSANSVTDIIFFADNLFSTTYANVGRSHMFSFDGNADWNVSSAFRWSLYAGVQYDHMSADSELLKTTNCGWRANVSTNMTYTLPNKLRLSAWGGYWTPWRDLQSKGKDGYYWGLGASRSFLKDDALTLSANVNTLLPTHRISGYTQVSETAITRYRQRYQSWYASLSISFKFGGLKSDVKRTNASIENENASSGGSGSKGGN